MTNVHALFVPTNASDLSWAPAKNSDMFDAGTSQQTSLQDESVVDHLGAKHEADSLAHLPPVSGTDPGANSVTTTLGLGAGADSPASPMRARELGGGRHVSDSDRPGGSSVSDLARPASPLVHMGAAEIVSAGSSVPTSSVASPAVHWPNTRLQHGIRKPKIYTDGTIQYGLFVTSEEPRNHHEALDDPRWMLAMDHEFDTLIKNHTWHLVPPKEGANIIDCKLVYKIK